MARPSDTEYALRRKVKDLEDQLKVKDNKIKELEKKLDKLQSPEVEFKKTKKPVINACPDCGLEISITDLPHGIMQLCKAGCGFRRVVNK
jgi:sugar-specific transcriptional regulator TrmB